METMTRTPERLTPPMRARREPIVLNRHAERPMMVSWERIKFDRRMERRASLRRAWRVLTAAVVGIVGGLAMYAMAAAGLVPLLTGSGSAPVPAHAVSSAP